MEMIRENSQKIRSVKYKVENQVVSVDLKQDLSLKQVKTLYKDVEYNRNNFPGICIHFNIPKCAMLIFRNGKIIVTGLKTLKQASTILDYLINDLKKLNIFIKHRPKIKIVNLVVSLNYNSRLDLHYLALRLNHTIFEPEIFPGLIFRANTPSNCVFLIFSSGKVILTGLKSYEQIVPAAKYLGKLLKKLNLSKINNLHLIK